MMKPVTLLSLFVVATLLLTTNHTFSQDDSALMPYLKEGKFGYANGKGEIIIEPQFDYGLLFENGLARVKLDNKWGVIKEDGTFLLEPKARSFSGFDANGLAVVNMDRKFGVFNTKGKWVVPLECSRAEVTSNYIQIANADFQCSLLDLSGKTIVDFKYNQFVFPDESLPQSNLIIMMLNGQFGLLEIDKKGKVKERILPQYQSLKFRSGHLLEAKNDNKKGLVNSRGDLVVPFEYDNFKNEGAFIIGEQEIDYKYAVKLIELDDFWRNRSGEEIEKEFDEENKIVYYLLTQKELDQLRNMGGDIDNRTVTRSRYSVIDEEGKIVVPAQAGEIRINGHFIHVRNDKGVTLYDKKGKKASPLLFEHVDQVQEGLIMVRVKAEENAIENLQDSTERVRTIAFYNRYQFGFMDSTASFVLPLKYNGAFAFNLNRAPVRQGDKWALINKAGELITYFKYDQLYYAGANRYGFRLGKRWGLLDLDGREIIPAKYYEYQKASYDTDYWGGYSGLVFKNGKAKTSKEIPGFLQAHTTLIDTNGVQLFLFKYNTIEEQEGGLYMVSIGNRNGNRGSYGLIDQQGNELVPAHYNNMWWLKNEKVFVASSYGGGKYTYYDQEGKETESPYKHIEEEGLRDYKQLPNGFYSARYGQYTVYFTPTGIPLFEK